MKIYLSSLALSSLMEAVTSDNTSDILAPLTRFAVNCGLKAVGQCLKAEPMAQIIFLELF